MPTYCTEGHRSLAPRRDVKAMLLRERLLVLSVDEDTDTGRWRQALDVLVLLDVECE